MTHPQEESGVTQPQEKSGRTMRQLGLVGLLLGGGLLVVALPQLLGPRLSPDDISPMPTNSPETPEQVLLVKLKLDNTTKGIEVSYAQMAKYTLESEKITAFLSRALEKPDLVKWGTVYAHKPGEYHSRLSIKTNELTYIGIVLECTNCRYMSGEEPFRVQSNRKYYYRDARVSWLGKDGKVLDGTKPPASYERAIGYFIARAHKDFKKNGKTQNGVKAFSSSFNIYLELTYPNEKPVPISIDPDVGYPGGHTPEPTCTGENCGFVSPPIAPASAGSS